MVNSPSFRSSSYFTQSPIQERSQDFLRRDSSIITDWSNSRIRHRYSMFFVRPVFSTQKRGETPTCHRLTKTESVRILPTFQNGKLRIVEIYDPTE
ncbi:unnamed protein product [Rhizophagus irregularis]|nr:unnamed protein product [Rhizophagus irregularis]